MGFVLEQEPVSLSEAELAAFVESGCTTSAADTPQSSVFAVMRLLAAPAVRGALAALCPAGELPVHIRQLTRSFRPISQNERYLLDVDVNATATGHRGALLRYRLSDETAAPVNEGEVEMAFLSAAQIAARLA